MSLVSSLRNTFGQEFKRKDGFLARLNDPNDRQMVKAKRVATLSAVGAGGGAVVGGVIGGAAAYAEIQKVPVQTITVPFKVPQTVPTELGKIPEDNYTSVTGWSVGTSMDFQKPFQDRGVPTQPVIRNNPVYDANRVPLLKDAQQSFSGRGTPVVSWVTNDNLEHKMQGYNRLVIPHTESVWDHTEHYTESVNHPYTTTETDTSQDCVPQYNADGSSGQDCHTVTTTRSVSHDNYVDEPRTREIYRDELRGWWQKYSPDIKDQVVGKYSNPEVRFDHGVDVAGYIGKGIIIGATIGALAGGIAGAIEDKHHHLPGWKPLPGDEGFVTTEPNPPTNPSHPSLPPSGSNPTHPTIPVTPPSAPTEPRPDFGGYQVHAHAGKRHAHDGGDRWHCHGDPKLGLDPTNMDFICFKPGQVPSGYNLADGTPVDSNGSLCFTQKGRKG